MDDKFWKVKSIFCFDVPADSVLCARFSPFVIKFRGKIPTCVPRSTGIVVHLTRGGRGTGMGRGPRWRRCCTGGGMFCCGRRRWWVCRVSTDLACLLQHLVYGVHVCPYGIKRHSNAKKRTDRTVCGFTVCALNFLSHWSVFFFPFCCFAFDINDKMWRTKNDIAAMVSKSCRFSRIKS